MNDNEKLIDFWDNIFKDQQIEVVKGKWTEDDVFNSTIKKYIKEGSKVLDYGCGSGWGLIEVGYTIPLELGIGIDTSKNGVKFANETCKISEINNLSFIEGNQDLLLDYQDYFDSGISINLIDVLPDDITKKVLNNLNLSLKKDGYLLIGINPLFNEEFLKSIGYEIRDHYLYKDGIFRGNVKSKEEWISFLSKYFEFVEYREFTLDEREKNHPRRMFVLKKRG